MRCPTCDHIEDRVVDSRLSRGGRAIRRRRECIACGQRFTTYELVEKEPLTVRKTSGAIEATDAREVSSQAVGELVMRQLQVADHVSYVRFASVYRNFQDTTEFMEEVRELVTRARYQARGQHELFDAQDEASE